VETTMTTTFILTLAIWTVIGAFVWLTCWIDGHHPTHDPHIGHY
jgi:hypothetical protein